MTRFAARFVIRTSLAASTLLLGTSPTWADICMYRDAQGNVTYSNISEAPPKDAKKIRCFKEASPSASAPTTPSASERRKFPSVDSDTQRDRDDSRRRILEEELAAEQEQLAEAQRQLSEQESVRLGSERNYQRYLDRVTPYREAVEMHQRNVEALQREISNLR